MSAFSAASAAVKNLQLMALKMGSLSDPFVSEGIWQLHSLNKLNSVRRWAPVMKSVDVPVVFLISPLSRHWQFNFSKNRMLFYQVF